MVLDDKSAGGGFVPGSAEQTGLAPLPPLPQRAGTLSLRDLIDLYMRHYCGRDPTRTQRVGWWRARIGHLKLQALSDDDVHAALEVLAQQRSRYYAGDDVDGRWSRAAPPIGPWQGKFPAPKSGHAQGHDSGHQPKAPTGLQTNAVLRA